MEIRLGESIRKLRKQSGFTQEQLAEALGVSVSAVHKWESGKATPELEMLVDIAEFFETSVDAMLNYGWEKLNMGKAVNKLRIFPVEKNLDEGIRFAEKALQKYPNSFDVVYHSATIFFLTMDAKNMPRAIELYEKAINLIDQNTDDEITATTIKNSIAACYYRMGQMKEAVAIFKRNNAGGANNAVIGMLLSRDADRTSEALKYLSDSLVNSYRDLFNACAGYANAYIIHGELDKTYDLILWMHELGNGLRDTHTVNWMDRGNVILFTILAEVTYLRGDEKGACDWLLQAKQAAEKFDAAPEYHTGVGMKYYHSSPNATSYDDMGETALNMIENYMADDRDGKNLRPLWKKIMAGEINQPEVV